MITVIRHAVFPDDAGAVRDIWREYVNSPSVSLGYQGYEEEFAELPGKYAQPAGRLLLAERADAIEGCIALRRVTAVICEMKRLYVRPSARGGGIGGDLVAKLITEARVAGYKEMRLDVLAEFDRARAIYARFGFTVAEPISFNPVPGATFLGLRLE